MQLILLSRIKVATAFHDPYTNTVYVCWKWNACKSSNRYDGTIDSLNSDVASEQ